MVPAVEQVKVKGLPLPRNSLPPRAATARAAQLRRTMTALEAPAPERNAGVLGRKAVVAARSRFTYLSKPVSEREIKREMERQADQRH